MNVRAPFSGVLSGENTVGSTNFHFICISLVVNGALSSIRSLTYSHDIYLSFLTSKASCFWTEVIIVSCQNSQSYLFQVNILLQRRNHRYPWTFLFLVTLSTLDMSLECILCALSLPTTSALHHLDSYNSPQTRLLVSTPVTLCRPPSLQGYRKAELHLGHLHLPTPALNFKNSTWLLISL